MLTESPQDTASLNTGAGGASHPDRHHVAVLIAPGDGLFELATLTEVFGTDRPELRDPWYSFTLCAAEPGPVPTASRVPVIATGTLDDLATADTVAVVGTRDVDGTPPRRELDALRAAFRRGARVVSVCSGAFVLAAAGLLDRRRATTHWMYAERLAARYPKVSVVPDVLYVDEGQVLTSAGTAAGIDLALHIIRRDHGWSVANALARRMVVPPHREGGQAQFVEHPVPERDRSLHDLLAWLEERIHEPLDIPALARAAAVSERTLIRRFRSATGTTPHRWVQRRRVARAAHLLESTDLPVERIAALAGFGSATTLREHMRRLLGTSPTAYRITFRAPAFDGHPGADVGSGSYRVAR